METPLSNLPITPKDQDSSGAAKRFFNTYYSENISIPGEVLDASVAFFKARGFEESAAQSITTVLLSQAKIDQINVFKLLDTLKGLNDLQLSRIVREILNYNRLRISILGDRENNKNDIDYELRNIIA